MLRNILALLASLVALSSAQYANYTYDTYFYTTRVDHYGFLNSDTFQIRYLVNDDYFVAGGPIFFYTGNEGAITLFSNNTGFIWDIAPEFNALVVFAEHRYYGASLPYGNLSLTPDLQYVGYLNSEQALVDMAEIAQNIKDNFPGAINSTVIAFGGSYGGMLASWARIKFPHIFKGAIASSAPILQFTGVTPCPIFYQICTQDYTRYSVECSSSIRNSWDAINREAQTSAGLTFLQDTFKLCDPLTNAVDVTYFKYWLSNVWVNLAMIEYPYPANFLEPLPAYPISHVCAMLPDSNLPDEELLTNIASAVFFYFNYTGTAGSCLSIRQQATDELGDLGWDFQACTEMVMPFCSDGVNDMFEPSVWDFPTYAAGCQVRWGVTPQRYMVEYQYGAKDLLAASNIVFSNGGLDPWSGGGVTFNASDSVIAIKMTNAAHHLDLRSANAADTQELIDCRNQEKDNIRKWIAEDQANIYSHRSEQVKVAEKIKNRKKYFPRNHRDRPYRPFEQSNSVHRFFNK